MKKNSIFVIILSILITSANILLIHFCMPSEIPLHINIFEQIDSLCSKWLFIVLPLVLLLISILFIILKNNNQKLLFKSLLMVFIFEDVLILSYYCLESTFKTGMVYKIPLSILIFLPLSFLIIIWANIIKSAPFKSFFGIKTKYSTETEFLWKQIHFSAKNKFFIAGLLIFLMSMIFSFFKALLIEIILFFIIIISTYIILYCESKKIWTKYRQMQDKKEKLAQKKNKD